MSSPRKVRIKGENKETTLMVARGDERRGRRVTGHNHKHNHNHNHKHNPRRRKEKIKKKKKPQPTQPLP